MALPAITPYAMPTADELPANRVDWRPDPSRAALLIHDMQHHFLRAFDRGAQPVPQLLEAIGALRDACHELGIPVLFSAQPGAQTLEQRGLLQDFWGDGIGPDPRDAAIVPELAPIASDIELTKWRYSAFVRTSLHEELARHGRDQLIICGIYAHIGVMTTAAQAFSEEIQPFVVADAVADFSRADHDMAISWAARRCAVALTTDAALAALRSGAAAATPHSAPGEVSERGAAAPTPAEIRQRLEELLGEPLDGLADDDDVSDAGLDSIRLMMLVTSWQERGIEVSFDEVIEEPTIAAWAALLGERALVGSGSASSTH